jgi:hypothetical protein
VTAQTEFQGFEWPIDQWFRVPNAWFDAALEVATPAEMRVVLYVLRHTWASARPGELGFITFSEFQLGKLSGDFRIDDGVGMSEPSIRDGLAKAVDHGFLVAKELPRAGGGRPVKQYGLRMALDAEDLGSKRKNLAHQSKDSLVCGAVTPYTNNNTLSGCNQTKKSFVREEAEDHSTKEDGRRRGPITEFDRQCVTRFREVVIKAGKIKKNCKMDRWADEFRKMREYDGFSKKEIKNFLWWYRDHIGQQFIPEAHAATTFRAKIKNGQIPAAMRRTGGISSLDSETREEEVSSRYLQQRPDDIQRPQSAWDQDLLKEIEGKLNGV